MKEKSKWKAEAKTAAKRAVAAEAKANAEKGVSAFGKPCHWMLGVCNIVTLLCILAEPFSVLCCDVLDSEAHTCI